jgi:hypothetical protein
MLARHIQGYMQMGRVRPARAFASALKIVTIQTLNPIGKRGGDVSCLSVRHVTLALRSAQTRNAERRQDRWRWSATCPKCARKAACPHAAPRLRLQARQRWPRHTRDPGLSRASQHLEYDALYRVSAAAVQGILSGLNSFWPGPLRFVRTSAERTAFVCGCVV